MGMSASQARLLSLTARLSDLEGLAQNISNSKIRLADASCDASRKYQDALDKQVLTVMGDNNNYVNANALNLTTYGAVSSTDKQRFLCDNYNRIIINQKVANSYNGAMTRNVVAANGNNYNANDAQDYYDGYTAGVYNGGVSEFLRDTLGFSNLDEGSAAYGVAAGDLTKAQKTYIGQQIEYYTNIYTGKEAFMNSMGYTSNPDDANYDTAAAKYYENVFDQIAQNGASIVSDENMVDCDWLYNQLQAGNIYLSEWSAGAGEDGKGDWVNVSWSSGDSTIVAEGDKTGVAKAEAEYETTMADIEAKDSRFDLELKQIDTEHTAVQTEMDSVKKVIDKNIERSFKVFDA